mgnify:CR=1 FL=1
MLHKDEIVDRVINQLLEVRGKKPGKVVALAEADIKHLCSKSREVFLAQPNLLELEAPIKICGMLYYSISIDVFFNRTLLFVLYIYN